MRKEKKVENVLGRTVVIKEVTMRQAKSLQKELSGDLNNAKLLNLFEEILPDVSDIAKSDFDNLAGSEVKQIVEAFKEVNSDFFGTLGVEMAAKTPEPKSAGSLKVAQ